MTNRGRGDPPPRYPPVMLSFVIRHSSLVIRADGPKRPCLAREIWPAWVKSVPRGFSTVGSICDGGAHPTRGETWCLSVGQIVAQPAVGRNGRLVPRPPQRVITPAHPRGTAPHNGDASPVPRAGGREPPRRRLPSPTRGYARWPQRSLGG